MIRRRPLPTSGFTTHAAAFAEVLGDDPRLVEVVATDAHEGPVYVPGEDALYFTTSRPDVAIRRLALDGERFPIAPERLSTVAATTAVANGMALAPDGRLLVCDQGTPARPAAITALDPASGRAETLVDGWHGQPLNSPNDVAVTRDGAIWFTDPSYGALQGFRPEPVLGDRVYRLDPGGRELTVATEALDKPNGLAFSPAGSVLYLGDSGAPHRLEAFDVLPGGRLAGRHVVAELPPEHPDGLAVDEAGRVYASSPDGVRVFEPGGEPLGELRVPGGAVNFTFGGAGRNVLFITTDTAVWAAVLNVRGA